MSGGNASSTLVVTVIARSPGLPFPPPGVLYYTFDCPTDLYLDISGNNHGGVNGGAGVVNGVVATSGINGKSLHFTVNNGGEEFSTPHQADLDILYDMTAIAWIKPYGPHDGDPIDCTDGTIFSKGGSNWFQVTNQNGSLLLQNDGGPELAEAAFPGGPLTPNTWHQVAFVRTYDYGLDEYTITFFLDRQPLTPSVTVVSPPLPNTAPLSFGNYGFNGPSDCEFNGDIDEIHLYDTCMTDAFIYDEYRRIHDTAVPLPCGLYEITASANAGGTIDPDGVTVVGYGENQAYTITPDYGHKIADVLVDGVPQGEITSYAFNNVTANHTIEAQFLNLFHMAATSGSGSFGPKTDFATGSQPSSVELGDVNGDGNLDLVTANQGTGRVSVLLGDGLGAFGLGTEFAAGNQPRSVAIVDLNGDGDLDLAVGSESSSKVSVLLGTGGGAFAPKTDFTTGHSPASVAVGDLNGDGVPDLVAANSAASSVSVLLGDGLGGFGAKTDFTTAPGPTSVAVSDLNADGNPDAVAMSPVSPVSVLLGDGMGGFAPKTDFPTAAGAASLAVGDVSGDGIPDLVIANGGHNSVSVLLGTGTGSFGPNTDFPTYSSAECVRIGDLNGDPFPDLAVADHPGGVSVLLGAGGGSFGPYATSPAGSHPSSVAIGDLNGDGTLDLAVANEGSNRASVLLGLGGSIAPPGSTEYPEGSNVTYTITPASGYAINDVFVDGVSQGPVSSYAFTGLAADHRIDAQFLAVPPCTDPPDTLFHDDLDGTPGTDIVGTVPDMGGGAYGFMDLPNPGELLFAPGGGAQDVGPNSRSTHAGVRSALTVPYAMSSLASSDIVHLRVTMANIAADPSTNVLESSRVDLVTGTGLITLGELSFPSSPGTSNNGDWGANTDAGSPITSNRTTRQSGLFQLDLYLDSNNALGGGAVNGYLMVNGGPVVSGTIAGLTSGTTINAIQLVRNVDDEVFFRGLTLETMPACAFTGPPPCTPPPPDMTAWWPLDEFGYPNAIDIQGGVVAACVGTPAHVAGKVGNAVRLENAGQYVEAPSSAGLDFGTGDFSMDAWIRTSNPSTAVRTILDKRSSGSWAGYSLYLYNGKLGGQIADASGFTNNNSTSPVVTDGEWHHVAMTVIRTGDGTLYVDGAPVLVFDATLRPGSVTNPGSLRMGLTFNGATPFIGDIDEVELFNRALTGPEVLDLYDAGFSGKCRDVAGVPPSPDTPPTPFFLSILNNPLRAGNARVRFRLSRPDDVDVRVFDIAGRLEREVSLGALEAGDHDWTWDGTLEDGRATARGMYFIQVSLRGSGIRETGKILVLK